MQERARPQREELGPGPGGLGDIFAPSRDGGPVTVSHGPYREDLPVDGRSVGEIRARFADRFDIDPESLAIVDGRQVGDDTVVRAGQKLMFARRAGEKGQE